MSEATESTSVESAAPVEAEAAPPAAPEEQQPTEAPAPVPEAPAEAPPAEDNYDYVPKKFLDPEGKPDFKKLAESYAGLEKKLGSKPNMPASDISEYDFDFGDREIDEKARDEFKEAALKNGLTKDQYKFVVGAYAGIVDQLQWSPAKAEATLKEEWGGEFEQNVKASIAAFNEFAPSDVDPHDPVWNHPAVMKVLAAAGRELGEDVISKKGNAAGGSSIQEQINALRANPEYLTSQTLQDQMQALYAKLK